MRDMRSSTRCGMGRLGSSYGSVTPPLSAPAPEANPAQIAIVSTVALAGRTARILHIGTPPRYTPQRWDTRFGGAEPGSARARTRGCVELLHHGEHVRCRLMPAGAAGRAARGADADLDVRTGQLADDSAADLGDWLAGRHVRADLHER